MVSLRAYRTGDGPVLLSLFRDTVRRVNARDYSPDQVRAWASDEIDADAWEGRFAGRLALVAEAGGRPVGFADMEWPGQIDRLFVSADHQRRGVGRGLLEGLMAGARRRGIARLVVEASITARPFFESRGFSVLAPQVVTCRGAELVNYRMELRLA